MSKFPSTSTMVPQQYQHHLDQYHYHGLPVPAPSCHRLIKNQSSADDDDTIEETNEERLEIMVDKMIMIMTKFIIIVTIIIK